MPEVWPVCDLDKEGEEMTEEEYWHYRSNEESHCLRLREEALMGFDCSPAYRLRPKLSLDGNKWCALFGENMQAGVAGFGDTPAAAYIDFDRNWHKKLAP